jgi:hypothetical protein
VITQLDTWGISIAGVIDSDASKHGLAISGAPVCGADVLARGLRPFVVVASQYSPEISRELAARGHAPDRDFVTA